MAPAAARAKAEEEEEASPETVEEEGPVDAAARAAREVKGVARASPSSRSTPRLRCRARRFAQEREEEAATAELEVRAAGVVAVVHVRALHAKLEAAVKVARAAQVPAARAASRCRLSIAASDRRVT